MATDPKTKLAQDALAYHGSAPKGKLASVPTKPCNTQHDLSLAYTPGVAVPCMEIHNNPDAVWEYTGRANSVAVVSDGTAVLGLGNIGPEAGLPVKSVLFKKFADINSIPICLGSVFQENGKTDPKKVIEVVKTLEPTFGGINLEDIGSPACFEIEPALKKSMNIPVFHDDQHGTAIISLAGILNALKLVGKKIENCKFVMNGAGAAGIACAEYYVSAGARRENFTLCDSKGTIHSGRTDLNDQKKRFARPMTERTLAEAIKGADVFMGVSVGGALTKEMVASMAPGAVVFAMANPVPEINPQDAKDAGAAVVGTGRPRDGYQRNNEARRVESSCGDRVGTDSGGCSCPAEGSLSAGCGERRVRRRESAEGNLRYSETVRHPRGSARRRPRRRSRHEERSRQSHDRRFRCLRKICCGTHPQSQRIRKSES